MNWVDLGLAVIGGTLIGVSAVMLLWFNGRIAGISGIVGGLVRQTKGDVIWRVFFFAGLVAGGLATRALMPSAFPAELGPSLPVLGIAGFLVGFGARYGSGCTSGHGICGIGRLSFRSVAATLTFIGTGAITVFVVNHVLGGL